jgi:iron complex transport system ATP-binding protein
VGLAHLEHRLYPTLSGGERQRVQLARALAQLGGVEPGAPRILLLDEPTSSLDPAHQHGTLQLARSLARDGAAVLAVLHDLNLAAQYADVVALLHEGRLHAFGPPTDVLREAALTRIFGIPMRVVKAPWAPSRLLIAVEET